MNTKSLGFALLFLAAALGAFGWSYKRVANARTGNPLGVRLTFDYQGDVEGLFKMIEEKSGAHYDLDPKVLKRKVHVLARNDSVIQIQEKAAKRARLRYRPLDLAGKIVKVEPK